MTSRHYLILGASLLATFMARASIDTAAQQMQSRVVRLQNFKSIPVD